MTPAAGEGEFDRAIASRRRREAHDDAAGGAHGDAAGGAHGDAAGGAHGDAAGGAHGDAAGGAYGVYDVDVDPGWTIAGIPNGGYLLAMLGQAAVGSAAAIEGPDHPHVLTATAQYVSPTPIGPAELHTEVLRRGKRMSQVRARLVAEGAVRVDVSFTLGRLDPDVSPWWTDAVAPRATPREDCPRTSSSGPDRPPLALLDHVDQRIDPQHGFSFAEPSGHGQFWAWSSLADGRPHDPTSLLLAVDAVPPATIGLGTTGWVPTLSLTAYVRAVPAPGPVLVHQRARLVEDELVDEVCDVWDSRGRLVAQANQLAAVRTDGPAVKPSGSR